MRCYNAAMLRDFGTVIFSIALILTFFGLLWRRRGR